MHPDSHAQEAYNVESMHFVHVYAAAYQDHSGLFTYCGAHQVRAIASMRQRKLPPLIIPD